MNSDDLFEENESSEVASNPISPDPDSELPPGHVAAFPDPEAAELTPSPGPDMGFYFVTDGDHIADHL